MAEFDPKQLDRLEDALEDLEHPELGERELEPELVARLNDYRQVLELCRDALPSAEPPEALLADVLTEAREISRRPRLEPAERPGLAGRPGLWQRWRHLLAPALALATTAAVVLWLLDPGEREVASDLLVDDSSEQRTSSSDTPQAESQARSTQPTGESTPAAERATDANPDTDALEGLDASTETPPKARATSKRRASSSTPATQAEDTQAPAPPPMSKDETWTELERAHDQRRRGLCDAARSRYQDVIAAGADAMAIGQAKAGIGLCLEQDQRDDEAQGWFDAARRDNPSVTAWINRQRNDQPQPSEVKKAKRAKAADKAKLPAGDAL